MIAAPAVAGFAIDTLRVALVWKLYKNAFLTIKNNKDDIKETAGHAVKNTGKAAVQFTKDTGNFLKNNAIQLGALAYASNELVKGIKET